MKRIIFLITILISTLSFKQTIAQVGYDLNVDKQPKWGPVGYDHVDYYYLPGIECWYDVPHHQFVYREGKKWQRSPALPPKYKNYDLYKGYKLVVNQPQPYNDHDHYRNLYAKYKTKKSDPVLADVGKVPPPKVAIVRGPVIKPEQLHKILTTTPGSSAQMHPTKATQPVKSTHKVKSTHTVKSSHTVKSTEHH